MTSMSSILSLLSGLSGVYFALFLQYLLLQSTAVHEQARSLGLGWFGLVWVKVRRVLLLESSAVLISGWDGLGWMEISVQGYCMSTALRC